MRSATFSTLMLSIAVAAAIGCGGSQTGQASGPQGEHSARRGQNADAPSGPVLPSCDDGSCFKCGEGLCPKGFYCETNAGVAGCQWSTACAKEPSCGCLQPLMSADPRCSCEERDGAAFVTCSK